MHIKCKKLNDEAKIPTRGSACAAGYDLYAICDEPIDPGETKKIRTGICLEIPDGYFGAIYARSGLATKNGLRPANCVGVVDSDYRGEIIVALHNDSNLYQSIGKGDRVAQLVITPYIAPEFIVCDELAETDRGTGGFGSTGRNFAFAPLYNPTVGCMGDTYEAQMSIPGA